MSGTRDASWTSMDAMKGEMTANMSLARTTSLVRHSSIKRGRESDVFTFDPDGDLILILTYPAEKEAHTEPHLTRTSSMKAPTSNPNSLRQAKAQSEPDINRNASMPTSTNNLLSNREAYAMSEQNILRHTSMRTSENNIIFPPTAPPSEQEDISRTSSMRTTKTVTSPKPTNANLMSGETLVTVPTIPPLQPPQRKARMVVSSKHLMLASPVFKAMLQYSCFKEGELMKASGKAEVPLHDDDPITFEILMYIIHGRPKRVPRQITLETFVKLAVLVDKYQMLEIMDLYVEMWMVELKKSVPESLTDDILSWLCVSLVFRMPVEFANLTRILIWEGEWRVENRLEQGLPIPDGIFQKIEKKRKKTISNILETIQALTNTFAGKIGVCGVSSEVKLKRHRNCDGMMLGTLLKSASEINIWPAPEDPYEGITIKELIGKVREMQFTSLCDVSNANGKSNEAHGFLDWVKEKMDEHEKSVKGLKLGVFQCYQVNPI